MRNFFIRGMLCVFLWVPIGGSAEESFSDIFIFGDSLSDNGNLASVPGFEFLSMFPYDDGFSNGPRAVEVLAEGLDLDADPSLHLVRTFPLGTNFAVAGARAVTLGVPPTIDLPTQIGSFLLSRNGVAPADALYMVFIGGNDIRDARDESDRRAAKAIIREAVEGVAGAIRSLAGAGAERILVANAPDIGAIPETRALGDQKFAKRATKLTKSFNKRLAKAVRNAEWDFDLEIMEFDTFRFVRLIRKLGVRFGLFTNTDDACFFTFLGKFNPECEFGKNFENFVFFDEIHPTAKVHQLTGEAMLEVVLDDDDDDDDDHDDDYDRDNDNDNDKRSAH
ncbi:MAG: SGNH/GDSL hydrolase family protein [Gammaproteobacteria bacterium]|nr:MAG: SGNH/GDSL hydrolase family protein [Gammaproteobacteria bacterium]